MKSILIIIFYINVVAFYGLNIESAIKKLNDTEKGILDAVAASDTRAAIKAQLLLKTFYGEEYEKHFPVFEESSAKRSNDLDKPIPFKVYPNPANDLINLVYNPENYNTVSLYNSSGQLIKQVNVSSKGFDTLNIQQLSSGIYYIKLQGENAIDLNKKVIVLK